MDDYDCIAFSTFLEQFFLPFYTLNGCSLDSPSIVVCVDSLLTLALFLSLSQKAPRYFGNRQMMGAQGDCVTASASAVAVSVSHRTIIDKVLKADSGEYVTRCLFLKALQKQLSSSVVCHRRLSANSQIVYRKMKMCC